MICYLYQHPTRNIFWLLFFRIPTYEEIVAEEEQVHSDFSNSSIIIINELNVAKCSLVNGFLVSKETVVLHRWERSKQKFGFIKRVDIG